MAMLSKYLIQFSVDGQSCDPSLLFDLRSSYGGGMKKGPSKGPVHAEPLTLQQNTADPRQENALLTENTLFQQHKRRLHIWTTPDGQYENEIDYILCSQRWRSSIQSATIRPGADCGSDHFPLITKLGHKLKKGKTLDHSGMTKQIPYDYTVEVRNRFKGLDLIDRVPEELWTEVCDIVQEAVIKTIPKEKQCKKAKWFSEEGLQIAIKR